MKKRVCALTDNQGTVTLGHLKTTLNPNRNLHFFLPSPPPAPPLQCCGFLGFLWLATNIVRGGGEGGRRTKNLK